MIQVPDNFEARVRESFDRQGFMGHIGATLSRVGPGVCHIVVPFSEYLTQQHGLWHGGVTATLADNACGFAGFTTMAADQQPLSVEFKISFVAPARGDRLEARATVVSNGRRLKHVRCEIHSLDGAEDPVIAVALATVAATRSVTEKG